jgi:hypothetical protein
MPSNFGCSLIWNEMQKYGKLFSFLDGGSIQKRSSGLNGASPNGFLSQVAY